MPRNKKSIAERERAEKGTGGVYPEGRMWRAKVPNGQFYPDGTPKYTSRIRNTQQKADAELKKLRAMLANNELTVGSNIKFRQYTEEILFDKSERVSRSTSDNYYRDLRNHVFPAIGGKKLVEIKHTEIQELLNKIRRTHSASTHNKVRTAMGHVFEHARKHGLMNTNPVRLTEKAHKYAYEKNYWEDPWTLEEALKVLDECKGDSLEAFLTLALNLGARLGELLALEWSDIDFKNYTITIDKSVNHRSLLQRDGSAVYGAIVSSPKTQAGIRVLDSTKTVFDALRSHKLNQDLQREILGEKWEDKNLVFTNKLGGYTSRKTLRTHYSIFLKRIGVRYIRLHDNRHTFATLVIEGDPRLLGPVSRTLGHSSLAITHNVYAKQAKIQHHATYAISDIFYPGQPKGPKPDLAGSFVKETIALVDDVFGRNERWKSRR